MKVKQIVIAAGGLGTRLRPITEKIPKPMIEIKGKPFLEYVFSLLKKQGFKDILLLTGYKHEVIKNYFEDGSRFDLNISYSVESKPLGTGGALLHARDLLDDNFILIWGDTYYPINYNNLVSLFNKETKLGLMAVYNNRDKVATNNVWVENNYVKAYFKREEHDASDIKPSDSEIIEKLNGIDTGSYVYNKDILHLFPKKEEFSLEKEVYKKLIENHEFLGYLNNTRFFDIGTFERLKLFESIKV